MLKLFSNSKICLIGEWSIEFPKPQFFFSRNESGVIADLVLRFGNDSKNLVSLDALIKTGSLGTLPVDPASLTAGTLHAHMF